LIGYPVRDARRNESERIAQIFREVYNVKRVFPGERAPMVKLRRVLT
jgi:hypothetical protein